MRNTNNNIESRDNINSVLRDLKVKNHNKIIIGHLNINSIPSKFEQLKAIIHGNIDILVVTETRLDDTFPTSQFYMEGYSEPYQMDRNRKGGGVLIFVREDIPSKRLNRHNFPVDMEGIFLEINLRKKKWLLFGSYHPPSQNDEYFFTNLEKVLDIYNDFYNNFLLAGDFNTEDSEPCLSNFLYQYEARNLVKEKTCFKNPNNPSCIDLFITNSSNSFQNTGVVSTGLSDFHKMVVTVLKSTYTKAKPKEIAYRNYKDFDQTTFNKDLKTNLQLEIVKNYIDFEGIFLEVLNKHAPMKKKTIRDKKFWKTIKPLFSEKGQKNQKITIVKDNEIISEDKEVAETLNSFFQGAVDSLEIKENEYLKNPTIGMDNPVDIALKKFECHPSILKIRETVAPTRFSFSELSMSEVEKELIQLNPKKACTFQNIPPKHLKQSSDVCVPVLCDLINESIRNNEFPKELKVADITPVFKKDDATSVKNYRPVSVLPVVSKIYERIIQRQIINHIDTYLSPYLCGYRKGFNAQHALTSLIEKWKLSLDKHGYAGAILMDLSKAFDTLNHELLIAKLYAYGFNKNALDFVFSYLTNRWQRTKINKSFSSWSELLSGVPQGSVLGPLLFNIYINDLFWLNEQTNVCNYADDTTFYACEQDLESLLQRLEHDSLLAIEWFENNYMKLNDDKCHLLISGFKYQSHWAMVGTSKIWESQHEKLLGVTIDKELKFKLHISNICVKAGRKLTALGRLSRLIPLNKRKVLFKAFIDSQFAYCPLTWMFHDRTLNNKINHLHERALRIVYKDDCSSFDELLKKDDAVTIHHRNIQTIAIELYKYKNGLSPVIMNEIFLDKKYTGGPKLRSKTEFCIPRVNTVYKGDDSLRHLGPLIWEILPDKLKQCPSLTRFRTEIKKWVPFNCPCRLCKDYIPGIGYVNLC